MAGQDLGDFYYLLEVYNEIKHRKVLSDDVQVQLRVIAPEKQQEKILKTFKQANEIDIDWQGFDFTTGFTSGEALSRARDVDLTLALAAFPVRKQKPIYPWLELVQFRSVFLNPYNHQLMKPHSDAVEKYFHKAQENDSGSISFEYKEGNPDQLKDKTAASNMLKFWSISQLIQDLAGLPPYVYSLGKPVLCEHSIQFGLQNTIGLPINSGLREKVEEFEKSEYKHGTAMVEDLKKLFVEKPWLAEAVTKSSDPEEQLQTFFDQPYFAAYHHEIANLKEYMAIIGQLTTQATLISTLKWNRVNTRLLREIFAQLGYSQVDYISENTNETLLIPEAAGCKKLRIINPGKIQDENAYNAMLYFSQPLVHVAGNISLVKAITMNKLPFYEWRYFHTHMNPSLQKLWQGTGYESLFVNEYNPEGKAAVLKQVGFDRDVLSRVNQNIVVSHNAMPALMGVIRLAYMPDHPLWELAKELDSLVEDRAFEKAVQLVLSQKDPALRM